MPSSSRPKSSYAPPRAPAGTPMSERQQMALVLQMTSQTSQSATANTPPGSVRSRDRNERGETALHIAAIKGDHEKVKKLLDQGADPNATDFAGWTPLHEACSNGWQKIAVLLIQAGANINAHGFENDTPLHDAASNGQINLVKYLLDSGADPCLKNSQGKMPFDVARPPADEILANVTESTSTSQRAPHPGRLRDDNKKNTATEDSSTSAGCSTTIMETLSKTTEEKIECKDTTVSTNSDKSVASAVVIKSNEGESSSGNAGSGTSSQEDTLKRPFPDNESGETEVSEEDAIKKKKRKESTEPAKETTKSTQQSRVNVGRNSLVSGSKPPGPASKTGVAPLSKGGGPLGGSSGPKASGTGPKGGATGSGKGSTGAQGKGTGSKVPGTPGPVAGGKKSPCPSPKPPVRGEENATDSEETKTDGPKVPPLKIVIPGGGGGASQEGEGGGAQRGSTKSRGGSSTLPYIIHLGVGATASNDGSGPSSGDSVNPPSGEEDKAGGSGGAQRVLRSHRNTDGGERDRDKERGRSSPHVSTTPCSPSGAPAPTPPPYHNRQSPERGNENNTENWNSGAGTSSSSAPACPPQSQPGPVELHPRKRKLKASRDSASTASTSGASCSSSSHSSAGPETQGSSQGSTDSGPSHLHPQSNSYQMYLNIKKQTERKQKNLFPVQPKPPQGFKDYLINRGSYVLKDNNSKQQPIVNPPQALPPQMREEFISQETERHALRVQHLVEKEKLVLAVEQEILRVHGKAARALANQALPFSVCILLKDREVYNMQTPEQEEKERNAQRSRYNGRLFLSWLQDVDDKWEKIKEGMVRRHHTEAESLHATQSMSWEWKLKELGICDYKSTPYIDHSHVPMVHVSDDFDLLPA